MARFACLPLTVIVLAGLVPAMPQDDPLLTPTLKPAEVRSLNRGAQKWIEAELKWEDDPKQRRNRDKERSRFMTELEKKSKQEDVLKNVGNLLAIFEMVFPYERESTYGEIKYYRDPPHHVLAPKGYRPNEKYASVLVMPAWDKAKNAWADPKQYIADSWKVSTLLDDTFVVVPELVKGSDYAAPVTEDSDKGRADEEARIRSVLGVLGEVQRTFRFDRRRMFMDCGPGTCGFGVRLASYFPSRFAGVILRAPGDIGKLRLDCLAGMPVLMVSTPETKANCEKIKAALDGLSPDTVTLVAGEGSWPFKNAGPEIDKWMKGQSRRLFPREVTMAPNHDHFHKSFWVEIIACEPLDAVAEKDRPYVKVKADREKNRIIVESRSVTEIGLYLNDYLVDLDKEVTLVINNEEIPGTQLQRSIRTVEMYMIKAYDPTALFTAYLRVDIPRTEDKTGKTGQNGKTDQTDKTDKTGKGQEGR